MIISASRRTDIPALYGDWFMERINEGFVKTVNPFNKRVKRVPLDTDSVDFIVFWSKNFIPFTHHLSSLRERGYKFYLNYTVNCYPHDIENLRDNHQSIIDNVISLSEHYRVLWRYDPVFLTDQLTRETHAASFTRLCRAFAGRIERVVINPISPYRKTQMKTGFTDNDMDIEKIRPLIMELADIAIAHNLTVTGCADSINGIGGLPQSHCIDKQLIESIIGRTLKIKINGFYPGCGCYESTDIGIYGTCAHDCIYCYANNSKLKSYLPLDKIYDTL